MDSILNNVATDVASAEGISLGTQIFNEYDGIIRTLIRASTDEKIWVRRSTNERPWPVCEPVRIFTTQFLTGKTFAPEIEPSSILMAELRKSGKYAAIECTFHLKGKCALVFVEVLLMRTGMHIEFQFEDGYIQWGVDDILISAKIREAMGK